MWDVNQREYSKGPLRELRGWSICWRTLAGIAQTGTCKQFHSTNRQDFLPDHGPAVTSLLGRVYLVNVLLEGEWASMGDNLISTVLKYTPLSGSTAFCRLLCLTCWTSLLYAYLHSSVVASSSWGNQEQPVCKNPLAWDLSASSNYNITFCNWPKNISLLSYIRKIIYPAPLVLRWHKRETKSQTKASVTLHWHQRLFPYNLLTATPAILFSCNTHRTIQINFNTHRIKRRGSISHIYKPLKNMLIFS